jgi:hypothetical protein
MSKKLNIIEAMKMPIGTEFEVIFNGEKMPNNTMKIYRSLEGKKDCKHMDWTCHPKEISMKPYDFLINGVFIPIQQPVSFIEAVADQNNKIMADISELDFPLYVKEKFSEHSYKSIRDMLFLLTNIFSDKGLSKVITKGKWYIEESEVGSDD